MEEAPHLPEVEDLFSCTTGRSATGQLDPKEGSDALFQFLLLYIPGYSSVHW